MKERTKLIIMKIILILAILAVSYFAIDLALNNIEYMR